MWSINYHFFKWEFITGLGYHDLFIPLSYTIGRFVSLSDKGHAVSFFFFLVSD